jgi:hypothetical protein
MALPFGVMIRQLKRMQMLSEITQVGDYWLVGCQSLKVETKVNAIPFLPSEEEEEEVCYRGGQAIALERVTCPSFSSHIMRTRQKRFVTGVGKLSP